jgi:hypothetical protein
MYVRMYVYIRIILALSILQTIQMILKVI